MKKMAPLLASSSLSPEGRARVRDSNNQIGLSLRASRICDNVEVGPRYKVVCDNRANEFVCGRVDNDNRANSVVIEEPYGFDHEDEDITTNVMDVFNQSDPDSGQTGQVMPTTKKKKLWR